jgi:hypothetical protein
VVGAGVDVPDLGLVTAGAKRRRNLIDFDNRAAEHAGGAVLVRPSRQIGLLLPSRTFSAANAPLLDVTKTPYWR